MTTPEFKVGDELSTTRGVRWSATGRYFVAGAKATVLEVLPDLCSEDGLSRYSVQINNETFELCASLLEVPVVITVPPRAV